MSTAQLEMLNMDPSFLNRNVNEGFSGGEKKRNEILQLAVLEVRGRGPTGIHVVCGCGRCMSIMPGWPLQADMCILDEIDSGLDIDALRDVSKAVNALKSEQSGVLMVTHYKVSRRLR